MISGPFTLWYDTFSKRFLNLKFEDVVVAEYEANRKLVTCGAVSLNDFYETLGAPTVPNGNKAGWTVELLAEDYGEYWIDFGNYFMDEKVHGRPCYELCCQCGPYYEEYEQEIVNFG